MSSSAPVSTDHKHSASYARYVSSIDLATAKATQLNNDSTIVFEYDGVLRPEWIRLVHLLPGDRTDPIICSLSAAPLNGNPEPFKAVSYVWGHETNPHKITCNWRVPAMGENGFFHIY